MLSAQRLRRMERAAYGDASQLSTLPQFVIKLIHYFGAEKGT